MNSYIFHPEKHLIKNTLIKRDEIAIMTITKVEYLYDLHYLYYISIEYKEKNFFSRLEVNKKGLTENFIIDMLKAYSSAFIKNEIEQEYLKKQINEINGV